MTDLLILGAGPAGMAASARAAGLGLSVVLIDEQPRAGGQIYREVDRVSGPRGAILGADYLRGRALTGALAHPRITHLGGATVWQVGAGPEVFLTRNGQAERIAGQRLLIATGALERPMPVPGWTLPGVMTTGAAQILLKRSGLVAERAVLAGSGPLLYLVAAQMVRAGTPPLALVETQRMGDLLAAQGHLTGALRGIRDLAKGLGLLADLRRAGVRRFTGVRDMAVLGDTRTEGIAFTTAKGPQQIACDTVLLHHGVVPNTQIPRSIEADHAWSDHQRCFAPVTDAWGETTVAGVFVAGDGGGILGAQAAELSGQLAALQVACTLGAITTGDRDLAARPLRRALARQRAFRRFLDRAYPPYSGGLAPKDDTVVCRCEEITAGQVRAAAARGAMGPNQCKAFLRVGMGPCQGRYCGATITELLASAHRQTPDQTGAFRIRPPIKPVTLGEIAAMVAASDTEAET
ncbi:FAD-dependent oxidoreductase [Mesobacterium sp. TK19101]|uniref:FAD-dependent oxidoreductase n=1 Tax=Mesobacterium hydrothermale TaxID=3111907 RepID=A0ABU6HG58_9RHOB|nr:FAD-dependent oxidoreductase [Mesobacterium sp. TK19101]MEC3861281.1 FAD-dependent oxidoreductase [Mesobacterium sp. TK19101]